jgi:hypothetical protein
VSFSYLETGTKAGEFFLSVLQQMQIKFISNDNVVFIFQCQKVQNNCQILLKRAETTIVLILF